MKHKILFAMFLIALCANSIFADSNCYLGSTTDADFKFNKREKIIFALPRNPSELEESFVEQIRDLLVEQKFRLVDSIQNAERILTFRIIENLVMNFESWAQTAWMQDLKSGIPSVQGGKITSSTIDSGYTRVEFSMQDIGLLKVGKRSTIWQSSVTTKKENFDEYPEQVLEKLVKLYGKKKVDDDKIKKPKRRKKN